MARLRNSVASYWLRRVQLNSGCVRSSCWRCCENNNTLWSFRFLWVHFRCEDHVKNIVDVFNECQSSLCLHVINLQPSARNKSPCEAPSAALQEDILIWWKGVGQAEGFLHPMVMEAGSLARRHRRRRGCPPASDSRELPPPTLTSFSASFVTAGRSSASAPSAAGASRESRGSGERKPEELSQCWVEEETWEMTGIWTEEEDEAAAATAAASPTAYTGWCWDSSNS